MLTIPSSQLYVKNVRGTWAGIFIVYQLCLQRFLLPCTFECLEKSFESTAWRHNMTYLNQLGTFTSSSWQVLWHIIFKSPKITGCRNLIRWKDRNLLYMWSNKHVFLEVLGKLTWNQLFIHSNSPHFRGSRQMNTGCYLFNLIIGSMLRHRVEKQLLESNELSPCPCLLQSVTSLNHSLYNEQLADFSWPQHTCHFTLWSHPWVISYMAAYIHTPL